MKKILVAFVFISLLLVITAGSVSTTAAQGNKPAATAPAGTPAPNGEINVPGVSIQIYAPGPNPLVNTADAHGHPAGILLGIWHGIISPVTIVMSFLNKGTQMYEVHNDGSPYNLGFFLGVLILLAVVGFLIGRR
jgi:hypothetical protein